MADSSLAMILALIRQWSGAEEPKRLLNRILDAAVKMMRASSGSIILIDESTASLSIEAARGFADRLVRTTRLKVGKGITGWVAKNGVPLRVTDVRKDRRYVSLKRNIRSELAAPLKLEGKVIGVINLDSTRLAAFSEADETALETLAMLSSRVIADALINDRLRRRSQQLEALVRIASELTATYSVERILADVTRAATELLGARLAVVRLTDKKGEFLEIAACHGGSKQYRRELTIPIARSAMGRVVIERQPLVIEDVALSPLFLLKRVARREGLHSMLAVPLVSSGHPVGVLAVYRATRGGYSDEDATIARVLADLAAVAIANARLVKSIIDTDQQSRRAQMRLATSEMSADLAHEIRNPMTVVRLLVAGGQQKEGLSPDDRAVALRELDRVDGLISRLIGKATAPTKVFSPVDLDAVLGDVVAVGLVKAASRDIAISHRGDAGWTRGDRDDLWQAFSNLLTNAIDAAKRRIRVRAARTADRSGVLVTIEDDGPGLPEKLPIFEPLVTTKPDGVGIGLFSTRRIILEHGGEITSGRSEKLGGARFRVVLPAVESVA